MIESGEAEIRKEMKRNTGRHKERAETDKTRQNRSKEREMKQKHKQRRNART